jgi:hypothetical protein
MSEIGYYRYKTIADAVKTISWIVNSSYVASKEVIPVQACEGSLILKYLDSNGQYRFYPFNKFYRTFDVPESIGKTNKFITNILNDQTSKQNIGFRNERKISLVADVPDAELEKLTDIYTSPRVYLYIGSGSSDAASDWLEVSQEIPDAIVRRRKRNSGKIEINLTLPKHFTIAMI